MNLGEHTGDPGHRALHLAFGELEQCQTGLGGTPELVRGAKRIVGGGEISSPTTDLADLVVTARGDEAVELPELLTGGERRLLRLGPIAAQAHDLGAVNAAGTGEAVHVLLLAPPAGRLRPLDRATVVAHVLARRDRHAVDEAGREGPQLTGDSRSARLVEDGEPLLDLAVLHQRSALAHEGQNLGVAVARAPRDVVGTLELRKGLSDVSLPQERRNAPGKGEISMLSRFGQALEQALRIREPAARDGEGGAVDVIPGERQRETGCAEPVAGCREAGVRALAQGDRLLEPPRPPGRVREALQVLRRKVALVRARVGVKCLTPGMPFSSLARFVDESGHPSKVPASPPRKGAATACASTQTPAS